MVSWGTVALAVLVLVVAAVAAALWWLRRNAVARADATHGVKKGSAVVMIGLSGAGKTQLFLTLQGNKGGRVTVPSMKEGQRTFRLVDAP
jgi:ABC-type polar amino acid transport system ATPase subunit